MYRVTLTTRESSAQLEQHAWRGKVVIKGNWAVPAWRYLRAAIALFWREAGL